LVVQNREQFQRTLRDWLRHNGLDGDLTFYTAACWRDRDEDYLNTADFVITTEGGLCMLLNYSDDERTLAEFDDLCSSFGYWYDLGHHWSIGFYTQETSATPRNDASYSDLLKDPRWTAKADAVKARADRQCQDCGASGVPLDAHHCWYRRGCAPWQYPLDSMRSLCRKCHQQRAAIEHAARMQLSRLRLNDIAAITGALDRLYYWYDRDAVTIFLEKLGPREEELSEAGFLLAHHKRAPH